MLKTDQATVQMSDTRPTRKIQLPFQRERAIRNGTPIKIIRYFGPRFDGQQMPYEMEITDPDNRLMDSQVNPLARCIDFTCDAFYSIEAVVDGLIKERDDLLLQQIETRGENERLKSQVAEMKRQLENGKKSRNGGQA